METTGRHLITLRRGRTRDATVSLQAITGSIPADSREFGFGVSAVEERPSTIVYERLGIAIGTVDPEQAVAVASADDIISVEPERICYVTYSDDYLRGFQAGVNAVASQMLSAGGTARSINTAHASDEARVTWGLQATKASESRYSGKGIRVAILDTGLFSKHPDFVSRPGITMKSFISGVATAEDGHGHGTHCAGTACGPATTQTPPRYGVAPSADLFIGKVLNDQGFGVDGDILAGIDWALEQGCNVISMSLAAAVAPGATYSAAYEQAAVAAREQGCLIVSAAGNDSRRPGLIAPVGHPANCPTILAIAAIDDQMQVAPFSNGHVGSGKTPWLAGPGVQVYSSWISPRLYNTIGGTSMATPHAAGIVALFAESTGLRGTALENAVLSGCLKLGLPASDIGGGLPQAP